MVFNDRHKLEALIDKYGESYIVRIVNAFDDLKTALSITRIVLAEIESRENTLSLHGQRVSNDVMATILLIDQAIAKAEGR